MKIREKFVLFFTGENSIERTILLSVSILFPFLVLIELLMGQQIRQYSYFRIGLGIISLALLSASFRIYFIKNYLSYIVTVIIYVTTAHAVFLNYLNNFSFYYSSLLVSIVIISCFYFSTWKQVLLYQLMMFVFLLQASVLSDNTIMNIGIFLAFYVVINIIVFFIQLYIFRQKHALNKIAQQLEVAAKNLERSNKSLEQFAYVASHDLQEPLRTVNSYMQLIQKRFPDKIGKDGDEFIQIAVTAVKRMQTLIKGLLKYSRTSSERMEMQNVDLNEILGNVLQNLETSITENEAHVSIMQMPVLKGDRLQLSQLFQNLISNSLKYRSQNTPEIKINHHKKENYCVISIADNGIGIPEKSKENVFRIFNRLNYEKSNAEGSGIGLAICKKIVMNHHGEIWVDSELGKGSTFYFTLQQN